MKKKLFGKLCIFFLCIIIPEPVTVNAQTINKSDGFIIKDTIIIAPRKPINHTPMTPPNWGFMVPLITFTGNPFQGNPDKYIQIYLRPGFTPKLGLSQEHYPSKEFYQLPDPTIRWYFNGVEVPENSGAKSFTFNSADYWPIVLAQDTVSVSIRVTAENEYGFAEAKGGVLMSREKLLSHFLVWADRDSVRHGDTLHFYAQAMEAIGDEERPIVYPTDVVLWCYLNSAGERLGSFLLSDSSKVKEIPAATYGQLRIENGGLRYIADGDMPEGNIEEIEIGVVKVGFRPKGGFTTVAVIGEEEQLCPVVTLSPSSLSIGDTAEVTIRGKIEDENGVRYVDYPAGQLFNVRLTEGESYGDLWEVNTERKMDILEGAVLPIRFIAANAIDADSVVFTVRAVAVEPTQTVTTSLAKTGEKTTSMKMEYKEVISATCPLQPEASGTIEKPEIILSLKELKEPFLITKEPQMPPLEFIIEVKNVPLDATFTYEYKMNIAWTDPLGKEWKPEKPFEHTNRSNSSTDTWKVDWGIGTFVGGDEITVEAKVTINGEPYDGEPLVNKFKILGTNPDKIDAVAGLSDYERAVMFKESTYRQFSVTDNSSNKQKYPLINLNKDKGVATSIDRGIKQINSTHEEDAVDPFSLKHVWSWKANKAIGMRILNEAKNAAAAWPKKIRENKAGSDYKDWFKYKGYRGCPEKFPDDMHLWIETYRRYNGGPRWAYWFWDPNDLGDPDAGGEWKKIDYSAEKRENDRRPDAAKYAEDVWNNIVQSNPKPKGW